MGRIIVTDDALKKAAASVRQAMLDALPEPEACRHRFSPEFEEKMERLLERERRRGRRRAVGRRVAAVFLAALIAAGVWLAVDTQARASFVRWVREVYETRIVYRFTGEAPAGPLPEYRLGWLPEGYEEVSVTGTEEIWTALYQKGEDALTIVYYQVETGEIGTLYNFGSDGEPMTVHGHSGYFYPAADESSSASLVWIDEEQGIFFAVSGYLSSDDMLHIAESLYLENMTK